MASAARRDNDRDREIESWIQAAKSSDGRGYTNLYRLLAGRVAGYVRGLGVDEVDDVVNEVFLGAFRNLETYVGDGAGFRTWLFSIAHHKAVDALRASARRPTPVDLTTTRLQVERVGDVEHEAIASLGTAEIDEILAVLTLDQREVVMLRVIADLSLEQVAQTLAKPVGAIKSIQHRALATLRRAMDSQPVSSQPQPTNTPRRTACTETARTDLKNFGAAN